MSADRALEIEDLHVRYGEVHAVRGVSFGAKAGEVTVVLGPNGAGKTSTIEACEGFRVVDSGRIRVLGLDPARHQRKLAAMMGVMLQEDGVYPAAQVLETITQYCSIYERGVDPHQLLGEVGLKHRAKQRWKQLSGGEKQRLSLALALASRPEIAFLDEPTSGVDIEGRDQIRSVVRGLAEDGCAVIVATHELDEAERMADRVVIFDSGNIVADDSLEALRSGRQQIKFQTNKPIDAKSLQAAIGHRVSPWPPGAVSGSATAYCIESTPEAELMTQITSWLASTGVGLLSIEGGSESLEAVFRRLTVSKDGGAER